MINQTKIQAVLTIQKQFTCFIDQINENQAKLWILSASKKFNIRIYNLQKISPKKIKDMYSTIVQRFYMTQKYKDQWLENQLRIFVWVLICYGQKLKKEPSEFTKEDWGLLEQFFIGKNIQLFQFQYNSLKIRSTKFQKWTQQEDQLLLSIIKQFQNSTLWNRISREFFTQSQKKYFRTAKQCRQRWNNYLDPSKYRGGQWSIQEDYFLINYIVNKGKRWSNIAKQLVNERTEHMVKNRYKSLLAKEKKKQKIKNSLGQTKLINKLLLKLKSQLDEGKLQIVKKEQDIVNQEQKIKKVAITMNAAQDSDSQQQALYEQYQQDKKHIPIVIEQQQVINGYIQQEQFLKQNGFFSTTNQQKFTLYDLNSPMYEDRLAQIQQFETPSHRNTFDMLQQLF